MGFLSSQNLKAEKEKRRALLVEGGHHHSGLGLCLELAGLSHLHQKRALVADRVKGDAVTYLDLDPGQLSLA